MLNKYKLIASLLVLLIFYNPVYSQCTITGQTNGKMIYAENGVDTTINAQVITVIYALPGQAFNEVFQLSIPQDTLIDYQGTTYNATISNMVLDSVVNLPPGSAHTCNPSCTFNGNSNGCVQVSGIVTVPDTGFYKLYINTTTNLLINTGFITVPYSYTSVDSSYAFIIKENSSNANPLSIQERLNVGETPLAIYNSDSSLLDSLYGKTYEGGLIFYLDTITGYGFVAAESDQSTGAPWGCSGDSLPGADGSNVGTGALNTLDIELGCSTSGIAAELCAELGMNGYYDWFLPNSNELLEMYTNLHALGYGGFDTTSNTLGEYWSSTEANNNYGRTRKFTSGGPYTRGKSASLNVRACRYFGLPEVGISQGDTTICYGDSLMLVVMGASDSLNWSSGYTGSPVYVSPTQSTTYYVSIYNGWAGRIDSVHLNVDMAIADFSADNTYSSCIPLSVNFSDSSSLNIVMWSWNFGDGTYSSDSNPSHTYVNNGVYTVALTVSNSNACSGTISKDSLIQVSYSALGVVGVVTGTDSVCAGDTVTYTIDSLANADNYFWSIDSSHTLIGASNTNSISVLWGNASPGTICVYAINNCDTSDTACLMVYENCTVTNTEETGLSDDINIYPNPFSESLNIEFNRGNNDSYSYMIYDLLGNIVRQQENLLINKLSIQKYDLNNGVYFIQFKCGGKRIDRKIIVE